MALTPFVHSGYERRENDDYQTIDRRCVQALIESCTLTPSGLLRPETKIVDFCASHGSGIVDAFVEKGFDAQGVPYAFSNLNAFDILVTNPPYDRKVVDRFVAHAIAEIRDNHIKSAYFLMRANWDFAISRAAFFDSPNYAGQIRMRFRPWWSEDRKAQPIHNYVWHCWGRVAPANPIIRYWPRPDLGAAE